MNQNPQKKYESADLFKQLGSGSQRALAGIILLYRERLITYILEYVPDRQVASQVFNQTIFSLWQQREALSRLKDPHTWMISIANHHALNAFRNEKKYQTMLKRSVKAEQELTSTEARAEYRELLAHIEKAGKQLPQREKLIFDLYMQNGWSVQEMALHCNASEKTIRNQLSRAMKKIRIHLKKVFNGLFI